MGSASSYGGYYQDSPSAFPGAGLSQGGMPYQPADYGQDARQPQNFGAYNPNIMYPVGQAGSQNPYDAAQQFHGRQSAPMPMMGGDVPQYFQSDAGSAATPPIPAGQSASATPSSSGIYPQQPQMPGFPGQVPSAGAGAGAGAGPGTAGMAVSDPEYSTAGSGMEERWADYQARLAVVFKDVQDGTLNRTSGTLLGISSWLLTHVVELGLNVDDRSLHADRLKLWNDFNHGWLGLLQKQKDMMESGQKPQGGQSLISKDDLENMGKELVRLCDGVEKHGLVDYQYGVWEEQIIAVLTDCLDLYESGDESGPSGGLA
ncbi:uncharacterized protein DNG_00748 [Cephalotrichum gorgonifer]|uniref:Uncharacterized protein n=1 Tax=Cephalotrichum gorgonifer TaxID=2041049 RepID=A0AAE8MRT0_9PEZI|nr:uncharacterized protein DNG_00748 [Cephalotrichum gorgonifer]